MAQEFRFCGNPLAPAVAGNVAIRSKNAVTGDNDGDGVAAHRSANGPRRATHPGSLAKLVVGESVAKRNSRKRCPDGLLERGSGICQWQVKCRALTGEILAELHRGLAENVRIDGVDALLR